MLRVHSKCSHPLPGAQVVYPGTSFHGDCRRRWAEALSSSPRCVTLARHHPGRVPGDALIKNVYGNQLQSSERLPFVLVGQPPVCKTVFPAFPSMAPGYHVCPRTRPASPAKCPGFHRPWPLVLSFLFSFSSPFRQGLTLTEGGEGKESPRGRVRILFSGQSLS